jgi:hypothetical protein
LLSISEASGHHGWGDIKEHSRAVHIMKDRKQRKWDIGRGQEQNLYSRSHPQ